MVTLTIFFSHENQPSPPSLSANGKMFLGTKSDIVKCLSSAKNAERAVESMTQVNNEQQPNQDQHKIISQAPVVEATILDAAAVINIKKAGLNECEIIPRLCRESLYSIC